MPSTTRFEIEHAYVAGNVQVSDTHLVLKSKDPWVTFTNNSWGPGLAEGSGCRSGYGGGSTSLATDGSAFYSEPSKLDALDVTHALRTFPKAIYGANGDIAPGNGKVYVVRGLEVPPRRRTLTTQREA